MMSECEDRLKHAGEAWTRLFQRAKPIQITDTQNQLTQINSQHKPTTRTKNISLSQENLITNTPWGDTLQDKPNHTTRLYIQNVNGIKLHQDGGQFDELCTIFKEVQADVACIQEHNLDTTQYEIRRTLYNTAHRHWQRNRLTIASTPIPFSGPWKPGGTAIMSTGSITGRITGKGQDPWGRWCYQTFLGRNGRTITIMSAYQVVDKPTSKGQYTSAAQQQSLLLRQSDPISDPRKAFRRDLSEFLETTTKAGNDIIITGDFNERLGEAPSGMSKIATQFALVDVMAHQHPHLNEPATYARGQKRLDYILVSPSLASAVKHCGYEQFDYRFHTDHRAYFIDFDTEQLFGSPTQPLAAYPTRTLHSNNIKQVTQYIKRKHALLSACNAFTRSKRLEKDGNRHAFAERLDADVTRACLSAERSVQRYRNPDWSIELADARKKVSILSKILSMATTSIDHIQIVRNEMKELNESILIPDTIAECSTELKQGKRKVAEIVKRCYATRESERDRLIAELENDILDSKNKQKIRILKQLKKAEAIKNMFQKLQTLRMAKTRSGITRLEVPMDAADNPKTCTRWKMIDLPTEILEHLQLRNRKHFGQAHGSPFTISPLYDDLGFKGNTNSADIILRGEYNAAHLDKAVQHLLTHLRRTEIAQGYQPLKATISQMEYVGKIKSWRESTSTSPSGLHLGHYKAMIARHAFSDLPTDDPMRLDFETMQNDILELHLSLVNYAITRGFTYNRWCQVVNAMLLKEPDNLKIHRTRVIHIYEADYNLTMGIMWRAALFQAEEHKLLNPGQYGSRPSRGAHDPVFIEEMQLEISRLTRKPLVQINYDATSCYDRIIPNLAALVARKYGVPQPAVLTNTSTLERAQYRLKTEMGISQHYYTHTPPEWPIYGTGQGSGNSPAIWCFLSSVLFDGYAAKATGARYERPDRTGKIQIHMIGYVDDSNGQTNLFELDYPPAQQTLLAVAQADAQLWNDLLCASGGALELPKCTFQVLSWKFGAKGNPQAKGISNSEGITISDRGASSCRIPELPAQSAHKTLGHYKDPAGAQHQQYLVLLEKSNRAADFIARSPLNREEAWTYYFAIYLPSVGYPLANCHFTKSQLDKVQQKFMANIFAKCGFNRNTKREILFGPARLGGANFRSLYSIQGVGQVTSFLKYWRSPCQAGQLLRIALAWNQYAVGTSAPILEDTKTHLPHSESKWITSLRNFLASINGYIQVDDSLIPSKERVHDWHIMDAVIQSGIYTPDEIKAINYCRMYLQAATISDLANASGDVLDPHMLIGINHSESSVTKWHRFHQQRPPRKAWELWKHANQLWSDASGALSQPLGDWLLPCHKLRRHWLAYCSRNGSDIFYRQTTAPLRYVGYSIQRQTQVGERSYMLETYTNADVQIPDDATPVHAYVDNDGRRVVFLHRGAVPQQHKQHLAGRHQVTWQAPTFEDFVHSLENWESELLLRVNTKHDIFTTAYMMQAGFLAASDGSVGTANQGAFGWVIALKHGERLVRAAGPARGGRMSSYRAEGYGILSILRFLNRLTEYCQINQQWEWQLTCDNQSFVDKVDSRDQDGNTHQHMGNEVHDWTQWAEVMSSEIDEQDESNVTATQTTTINATLDPDWDVVNEVRWNLRKSGITGGRLEHIKGHQDQETEYSELPLSAQLNIDADRLAGEFRESMDHPETHVYMFPHAGAHLHLREGTCTAQIPQLLRRAATEQQLLDYLCQRYGWSTAVCNSIDWEAHHQAIKRNNKRRIQITKLIYDLVPTNKVVYRDDPKRQGCPGCSTCQLEDRDHVLQCGEKRREAWRAQALLTIERTCNTLRSDPNLTKILIQGLHNWLQQKPEPGPDPKEFPVKYARLLREQRNIGWRQVFSGRLSLEWARLQSDYQYIQRQRQQDAPYPPNRAAPRTLNQTGSQWSGAIINQCWTLWGEAWSLRNEIVHGNDSTSRNAAQHEKIHHRLTAIYKQKRFYEPSIQELLYDRMEEHTTHHSVTSIGNWLAVHETTFLQSMKTVQTRAIQGMRSIRSYFATGRPPGMNHNRNTGAINNNTESTTDKN